MVSQSAYTQALRCPNIVSLSHEAGAYLASKLQQCDPQHYQAVSVIQVLVFDP